LHLKFLAQLILTVLSPECNWSWQDRLFTAHPVFGRFNYVEKVGYVEDVSWQDHTAYTGTSRVYPYHKIQQTELIMKFLLHTNLQLLIALSSMQRVCVCVYIYIYICVCVYIYIYIHFYLQSCVIIHFQGHSDREWRVLSCIVEKFLVSLYRIEDKDPHSTGVYGFKPRQ
jgi:hypothetical protein